MHISERSLWISALLYTYSQLKLFSDGIAVQPLSTSPTRPFTLMCPFGPFSPHPTLNVVYGCCQACMGLDDSAWGSVHLHGFYCQFTFVTLLFQRVLSGARKFLRSRMTAKSSAVEPHATASKGASTGAGATLKRVRLSRSPGRCRRHGFCSRFHPISRLHRLDSETLVSLCCTVL